MIWLLHLNATLIFISRCAYAGGNKSCHVLNKVYGGSAYSVKCDGKSTYYSYCKKGLHWIWMSHCMRERLWTKKLNDSCYFKMHFDSFTIDMHNWKHVSRVLKYATFTFFRFERIQIVLMNPMDLIVSVSCRHQLCIIAGWNSTCFDRP
jgi:hypothetical protein